MTKQHPFSSTNLVFRLLKTPTWVTASVGLSFHGEEQQASVGNQAGGRVGFFLTTDNFERDYTTWTERGVKFRELPRTEPYGVVAVFEDLYGAPWDLIQPA